MKPDGLGLLDGFSDFRRGKRSIAILSPVGDVRQFGRFVSHVKKLGLDKKADFIFVVRSGLRLAASGLSELRCHERLPLGTSGCFFAGQALAYNLGYEAIVVADLDAFLDSRGTFEAMLRMARETGKAVVPLSKSPGEERPSGKYFVMNQWGAFPRGIFEKAGFALPYMVKGGEDYELSARLRRQGLLEVYAGGFAVHPRAGISIYHKMAEPGKFYPYVSGLMKAQLFAGQNARFLLWHSFYSFFADAASDAALRRAVSGAHLLAPPAAISQEPAFSIRAAESPGPYPAGLSGRAAFLSYSLASILLRGHASFGGDEIVILIPRLNFLVGLLFAALVSPLRAIQGLFALYSWKENSKAAVRPITPANAHEAAGAFIRILRGGV